MNVADFDNPPAFCGANPEETVRKSEEEWLNRLEAEFVRLEKENGRLREAKAEALEALRGLRSLCGPRAHRCGCECGGTNSPDIPTCKEAWSKANAVLDKWTPKGTESP